MAQENEQGNEAVRKRKNKKAYRRPTIRKHERLYKLGMGS